jgi:hypothetical protein
MKHCTGEALVGECMHVPDLECLQVKAEQQLLQNCLRHDHHEVDADGSSVGQHKLTAALTFKQRRSNQLRLTQLLSWQDMQDLASRQLQRKHDQNSAKLLS